MIKSVNFCYYSLEMLGLRFCSGIRRERFPLGGGDASGELPIRNLRFPGMPSPDSDRQGNQVNDRITRPLPVHQLQIYMAFAFFTRTRENYLRYTNRRGFKQRLSASCNVLFLAVGNVSFWNTSVGEALILINGLPLRTLRRDCRCRGRKCINVDLSRPRPFSISSLPIVFKFWHHVHLRRWEVNQLVNKRLRRSIEIGGDEAPLLIERVNCTGEDENV